MQTSTINYVLALQDRSIGIPETGNHPRYYLYAIDFTLEKIGQTCSQLNDNIAGVSNYNLNGTENMSESSKITEFER